VHTDVEVDVVARVAASVATGTAARANAAAVAAALTHRDMLIPLTPSTKPVESTVSPGQHGRR
jgi:hypothetical protein